ncbi:hypothetical protein niasHT_024537 [Heterodera trifolii]|uniref:Effector protein n=1 Tax=Heterodera trifolii TaxID=157864 RepID=A0ABD2K7U4_9BILA
MTFQLSLIVVIFALCAATFTLGQLQNAVKGKKCAKDQVVNKLTVYEDGAIEAECGPLPCGSTASTCAEDLSTCKAPSEVFSGMKWAQNGQSLLLRCCSMRASNKLYIGTDLVTLGSYYTGGIVPEQDLTTPGKGAVEYDFVANARTEQGGVRIWVYRVVCGGGPKKGTAPNAAQLPEAGESNDGPPQHKFSDAAVAQNGDEEPQQSPADPEQADGESEQAQQHNPLQYRPRTHRRRIRMAAMAGAGGNE